MNLYNMLILSQYNKIFNTSSKQQYLFSRNYIPYFVIIRSSFPPMGFTRSIKNITFETAYIKVKTKDDDIRTGYFEKSNSP